MAIMSSPLLVLVFVGIAGWQLWQRYETAQRAKVAGRLHRRPAHHQSPAAAAAAFVDLAEDAPRRLCRRWRGWHEADAMFAAGQQR